MSNIITIDLENELTQAEYCRRTGDTLGNLAPKLKRLSVREIPELGLKLINISHPSHDSIRIVAPTLREYTLTEVSGFFTNLLARYQGESNNKDLSIQMLEKSLLESVERYENMQQDNEQLKELCNTLEKELGEKSEYVDIKESEIAALKNEHIHQQQQFTSDREFFISQTQLRENESQELKEEIKKLKQEKETLEKSVLELEKKNVESKISEEFHAFRQDFISFMNNFGVANASEKKTKQPKGM